MDENIHKAVEYILAAASQYGLQSECITHFVLSVRSNPTATPEELMEFAFQALGSWDL